MHDNEVLKGELVQNERKAYAAPSLTVFGGLSELTAAGSGSSNESVGSDMGCVAGFVFQKNCGM